MSIILAPLALALAGGHAVADYGLQSAYMAEHKVRVLRRPRADGTVAEVPNPDWFVTLGAHCLIHAFMVLILTGAALFAGGLMDGAGVATAAAFACGMATVLGTFELGAHFAIDLSKGEGAFGYRTDQALHYLCKLAWLAAVGFTLR